MSQTYLSFLMALIALAPVSAAFAATFPPLPPDQMTSFNQSIMNEVQKQDQAAATALQTLGTEPSMSISEVARLNIIVEMDKVKHNLATNLLNTPSMNSPAVRQAFLTIMQQDLISEADLFSLQNLINSENAAMAGGTAPAPTGATAAVSPTGSTVPAATAPAPTAATGP